MKKLLFAVTLSLLSAQASAEVAALTRSCETGKCTWAEMVEVRGAPDKLVLKKFPSDGIEAYMPIGRTEVNGIPETAQGIWWISLNLPGDILCTFGNASWDASTRTATVPVYGAGNFSFHANETGASAYYPLLATHFTYEVKFTDNDHYATITPVLDFLGHRVSVPKLFVKFAMRYVSDGHWVRESWLLGKRLPDYDFLRVVRADGQRDDTYDAYLKVADEESYLAVKFE